LEKNILEFLLQKSIFGEPNKCPPPRENKKCFVREGAIIRQFQVYVGIERQKVFGNFQKKTNKLTYQIILVFLNVNQKQKPILILSN
jgi:hypothetical protein